MQINQEKTGDITIAGATGEATNFNVHDGSKLIEMILQAAYSDPLLAVVRELCQNASEVDPNFRIHIPTKLEPWFGVIDNGTGMSREDTIRHASGIGSSTKDTDNTSVGGFGIGMKVPFTVSDQYTIISRYNGTRYVFSAYKDDYNKPKFIPLSETPTEEHNGVEVRVPIRDVQTDTIIDKVTEALRYFNPKPQSNIPIDWTTEPEPILSGENWYIYPDRRRASIIMGNLYYPVRDWPDGIVVRAPIGSVSLPLSREEILYDNRTTTFLSKALDQVLSDVRQAVTDATKTECHNDVCNMIGAVFPLMDSITLDNGWNLKPHRIDVDGKYKGIISIRPGDLYRKNMSEMYSFPTVSGTTTIKVLTGHNDATRVRERINAFQSSGKYQIFLVPDNVKVPWRRLYGDKVRVEQFDDVIPKLPPRPRGVRKVANVKVVDNSTSYPQEASQIVSGNFYLATYRGDIQGTNARLSTLQPLIPDGKLLYLIPASAPKNATADLTHFMDYLKNTAGGVSEDQVKFVRGVHKLIASIGKECADQCQMLIDYAEQAEKIRNMKGFREAAVMYSGTDPEPESKFYQKYPMMEFTSHVYKNKDQIEIIKTYLKEN